VSTRGLPLTTDHLRALSPRHDTATKDLKLTPDGKASDSTTG
jgi:hypothetical protein